MTIFDLLRRAAKLDNTELERSCDLALSQACAPLVRADLLDQLEDHVAHWDDDEEEREARFRNRRHRESDRS